MRSHVFKVLAAALLLIAARPSMAALRGKSGTTGSAASWGLTYAGASSIQAGDLILIITYQTGGTGAFTITGPTGGCTFTDGTSFSPSLGGTVNGDQWDIQACIALAADAGTPTYDTSSTVGGGPYSQQILVYSGRKGTVVLNSGNSVISAAQTVSTGPTNTYDMSGLTSLAGDDIVVIQLIDSGAGTGATYATALSGYADALSMSTAASGPTIVSLDKVNSSAGATGSLATSITQTGGSSYSYVVGGFVLSIPSAAGGATSHVVISNGKVLMSNGKPVVW